MTARQEQSAGLAKMGASPSDADQLGRVRITAVKAMELRNSTGQSLVKIETDACLLYTSDAADE